MLPARYAPGTKQYDCLSGGVCGDTTSCGDELGCLGKSGVVFQQLRERRIFDSTDSSFHYVSQRSEFKSRRKGASEALPDMS